MPPFGPAYAHLSLGVVEGVVEGWATWAEFPAGIDPSWSRDRAGRGAVASVRGRPPMVYRVLADAVVLAHFAFIAFVAVGSLLARRRPALVWLHLPALAWAVGIVTVGYECPLTALENRLRRLGGERAYPGGFVNHYIENVLYPQRLTPLLLTLAGGTVVVGYLALLTDRRRRLASGIRGDRTSGQERSGGSGLAR